MRMESTDFFLYLAVMAGVTYAVRAIPFVLCKGEIQNVFVRSFLTYVPYAVLGAMTFPAIFSSTGNPASALVGTVVAFLLAFCERGLLTVAVCACVAALAVRVLLLFTASL